MDNLFADSTKFKKIDSDPTHTRLRTLQRYLNTIKKRGEINVDDHKLMRPKNAKPARAHGLPKTHKVFETVPKFRPIIDTIGSTHYKVGKYLTNLLQPLTVNDYTLKDSFDTASKIRDIPKELFHEGYVFASFDVTSLFTNVPLQRTINVIIDRIYNKAEIETTLKKSTLKKLIKDTCTKTVFSCNNQLYEQIDGVSMGSSMGPLLANIIMTELENTVIKKLVDDGTIKFYGRYVDDTLVVVKPDDISKIHDELNKFDKNIQFTVDTFENETPHFLDIEISPDGLSIFRKDTNTGQYTNFNSYTCWNHKSAWIRSLVVRAYRICSKNKLKRELFNIRRFASWNSFPLFTCNRLIEKTLSKLDKNDESDTTTDENTFTVWLKIPYLGDCGQNLVKSLERKLRRNLKKDKRLVFKSSFSTSKVSMFANNKDKTPMMSKSNVVYRFQCPGCSAEYIGKTDRNLQERCMEHSYRKDSAICNHLLSCQFFNDINKMLLFDQKPLNKKEQKEYFMNTISNNIKIIDSSEKWNILLIKEAIYIKKHCPILNNGLKASRDLYLFT